MTRAALVALALAACAPARPRPVAVAHATAPDCSAGDDAAAAAHWANRADEAEVRAALDAWWRAASACPADPARYLAIARADDFLANGHLALRMDGDPDAARDHVSYLADGAAAAEAGLAALSPEVARRRAAGDGMAAIAADLDAAAAPLLYWWADTTMLAATAQGTGAVIRVFSDVRGVMERVAELDPGYWYGGADRYLGAFYASAPAIAGGDLDRARAHLDAAVARAPGFLDNLLVYAVVYARAAHDDDLYRGLLEAIVAADPGADPDIAVEQAVAQEKARRLL